LDRFDLAISMSRPDVEDLVGAPRAESSAEVGERVRFARLEAATRGVRCNSELPSSSLEETVRMSPEAAALLERRLRSGVLSARGFHRVRRVARTIGDLDRVGAVVGELQVAEALSLRDARRTLLVDDDQ
jgi:magnesium chelatase family protein